MITPQRQRVRIISRVQCPPLSVRAKIAESCSPSSALHNTEPPRDLSKFVTPVDVCFASFGGFGDVWTGLLKVDSTTEASKVAVKHLRPRSNTKADWDRMDIRLHREILVWKRLRHPNIVPLLGTVSNCGPYPSTGMISPWMELGNLNSYLQTENLTDAHRLQLPCDIAAGLTYLHSEGIMHGDLTGANVLINDSGMACLIDFGLSLIKADFEGTAFITSTVGGAMRWRAPELIPPEDTGVYEKFKPTLTFACDIYSLGSVTLQALSGKAPYFNIKPDILVLIALTRGIRPSRPPCNILTDDYWKYIQRCWGVPESRPSAKEVHDALLRFRELALDEQITPIRDNMARTPTPSPHLFPDPYYVSWPSLG